MNSFNALLSLTKYSKITIMSCCLRLFFWSFFFSQILSVQGQSGTHKIEQEQGLKDIRTISTRLPFSEVEEEVVVEVINGYAIYHGDIIIGKIDELENRGATTTNPSLIWPNSTIPYVIDPAFNASQFQELTNAINNLAASTNLCLVPRTTESNYVSIIYDMAIGGGWSYIGMIGGGQELHLGTTNSTVVIHEFCHAAGMFHEQSRPDRDWYVTVNWQNIDPPQMYNFNICSNSCNSFGAYDFNSIMHYYSYAFSNNGYPTIIRNDGSIIGWNVSLTSGDIASINYLYPIGCPAGSCGALTSSPEERLVRGNISKFISSRMDKNFVETQKAYIMHEQEILDILEAGKPNPQGKAAKMYQELLSEGKWLLIKSFVLQQEVKIEKQHYQLLEALLKAIQSEAESVGLKAAINKTLYCLPIITDKELQEAILAFDQAGCDDFWREISEDENSEASNFEVVLLNSASDFAEIIFNTSTTDGFLSISLFDMNGTEVVIPVGRLCLRDEKSRYRIEKTNLPSGIYLVRVQYSIEDTNFQKVIKLPIVR